MTSTVGRPGSVPSGKRRRTSEVGRTGARFGPVGIHDRDQAAADAEPVDHPPPQASPDTARLQAEAARSDPASDPGPTGARFGPHSRRRHRDPAPAAERFRPTDAEQTGPIDFAPRQRGGELRGSGGERRERVGGLRERGGELRGSGASDVSVLVGRGSVAASRMGVGAGNASDLVGRQRVAASRFRVVSHCIVGVGRVGVGAGRGGPLILGWPVVCRAARGWRRSLRC